MSGRDTSDNATLKCEMTEGDGSRKREKTFDNGNTSARSRKNTSSPDEPNCHLFRIYRPREHSAVAAVSAGQAPLNDLLGIASMPTADYSCSTGLHRIEPIHFCEHAASFRQVFHVVVACSHSEDEKYT